MTSNEMTAEEEHAYYSDPQNLAPQGSTPGRRRLRMSDPVPVRFPADLLERVREQAAADDRSVSNWIRRAVEQELGRRSA